MTKNNNRSKNLNTAFKQQNEQKMTATRAKHNNTTKNNTINKKTPERPNNKSKYLQQEKNNANKNSQNN